jgi:hypothetical protein
MNFGPCQWEFLNIFPAIVALKWQESLLPFHHIFEANKREPKRKTASNKIKQKKVANIK